MHPGGGDRTAILGEEGAHRWQLDWQAMASTLGVRLRLTSRDWKQMASSMART